MMIKIFVYLFAFSVFSMNSTGETKYFRYDKLRELKKEQKIIEYYTTYPENNFEIVACFKCHNKWQCPISTKEIKSEQGLWCIIGEHKCTITDAKYYLVPKAETQNKANRVR